MITGRIDENLEARVKLQLVCEDNTVDVEFLVDTGFNGYLAVPPSSWRSVAAARQEPTTTETAKTNSIA